MGRQQPREFVWRVLLLVCGLVLLPGVSPAPLRCRCPPGHLTVIPCSSTRSAVCSPCHMGTYNTRSVGFEDSCLPCRRCRAREFIVQECSSTSDTVCAACSDEKSLSDQFKTVFSQHCRGKKLKTNPKSTLPRRRAQVLPAGRTFIKSMKLRRTDHFPDSLNSELIPMSRRNGLFHRSNDRSGRADTFGYSGMIFEEEEESRDVMDESSSGDIDNHIAVADSTVSSSARVTKSTASPIVRAVASTSKTRLARQMTSHNWLYTVLAALISALTFFVLGSCLGTFIHQSVARKQVKYVILEKRLQEQLNPKKSPVPLRHPRVVHLVSDGDEDLSPQPPPLSSTKPSNCQDDDVNDRKTLHSNALSPRYHGNKGAFKPIFNIPPIRP